MSNLKIVSVSGQSMVPYLGDYDQVYVRPETPQVGSLVLLNDGDFSVVHRYLGGNRWKGDRVLNFDQNFAMIGVVIGRSRAGRYVDLQNNFTFAMNQVVARLSPYNTEERLFRYLFLVGLIGILAFQRWSEDFFLGEYERNHL